ncbi:hypothetical protein G3I76_06030, partial [Streptomyces sp. SID11233]|nr:hypothetical protein [Streptomyces sp. SID11233]
MVEAQGTAAEDGATRFVIPAPAGSAGSPAVDTAADDAPAPARPGVLQGADR